MMMMMMMMMMTGKYTYYLCKVLVYVQRTKGPHLVIPLWGIPSVLCRILSTKSGNHKHFGYHIHEVLMVSLTALNIFLPTVLNTLMY